MNVLYLVDKHYVITKMSRVRFHSIGSLGKLCNVQISGVGWVNYDNTITVQQNIDILEKLNKKKYDAVICYKPLEYIDFCKVNALKIIRYNEMYNVNETINEILKSNPDIVISHHNNDYIKYKELFSDKYNYLNIEFFYIPLCARKDIFKDYNHKKIYDITFSGALGNSILGNHYSLRQKLLQISIELVKEHPEYKLYIHKHPGYELLDSYTNKYAIELAEIYNKSKICITCSGAPNTRFAKYVEIPSCNSVIIGDVPDIENDSLNDNFKDFIINVNLEMSDQEIKDKILSYLKNINKLEELREKGYKWSQKYSQAFYAKNLFEILIEKIDKIEESNKIVQTLWIGDSLTKIEQACIKRYIYNNHIVHLYTYGPIKNLPIISSDSKERFIIKDGNEILDKNEIFRYKNGSVSAFSNLFRFMLLYKKGGYWSDLDLINLKTLDFANDTVFVSEPTPDYKKNIPTTCLVKLKKNSIIARKLIDLCYKYKNKIINGEIEWGLGPKALKMIIEEFNLDNNIKPWYTVCSCHPNDTLSLFNTYYRQLNNKKEIIDKINIPNSMYGVHIWNKVINEYKLLDTKINKDSFIYYLIK